MAEVEPVDVLRHRVVDAQGDPLVEAQQVQRRDLEERLMQLQRRRPCGGGDRRRQRVADAAADEGREVDSVAIARRIAAGRQRPLRQRRRVVAEVGEQVFAGRIDQHAQ
jgi:hypothetical protein